MYTAFVAIWTPAVIMAWIRGVPWTWSLAALALGGIVAAINVNQWRLYRRRPERPKPAP